MFENDCLKVITDNRNYGWHCTVNPIDKPANICFVWPDGYIRMAQMPHVYTYVHVVHGCESCSEFHSKKMERNVKENTPILTRKPNSIASKYTYKQTDTRWNFLCHVQKSLLRPLCVVLCASYALYTVPHCATLTAINGLVWTKTIFVLSRNVVFRGNMYNVTTVVIVTVFRMKLKLK